MNFLTFMVVISSGLLICRLGWLLIEIDQDRYPEMCVCYCSDATMSSTDLTSRVEYTGLRKESCSCPDFLVPNLKQFVMINDPNTTCQICHCKEVVMVDQENDCKSFTFMFTTVTYSMIVITLMLALAVSLNQCLYPQRKHKPRSRSGYQRIGEHQLIGLTKEQKQRILGQNQTATQTAPTCEETNRLNILDSELQNKKQNIKLYSTFQL